MIKKIRLGDLLIKHEKISQEQLEQALAQQKSTGAKLGAVLVRQGTIGEEELLQFLAKQLNLPYLDLYHYPLKADIVKKINERMARRFRAVPIDEVKDSYLVAMSDPSDLIAFDELSKVLDKPVRVAVAKEAELLNIIDAVFRRTEEIAHLVGELEQEISDVSRDQDFAEVGSDAPIKQLLYSIFEDAVQVNASDIHIEPDEGAFRIRQRVDGMLHEEVMQGTAIVSALVLRLKLMAKLNISERRRPQDGRFAIQVKGRKLDVRLATMPVQHGESVALRLLDHEQNVKSLDSLGMSPHHQETFKKYLHAPHGMILVTGPTGSGKTTSLYAGLLEINTQENKIITVEDPVEYAFSRMNQVQVQPQIDLTFSNVLRSALRHDPDIIMVGEIRDEETASIALRSALTGHLVLSTLHTFNALSAPMRLIDMGVPAYLVASSIRCVIAQRLIRRLCESCLVSDELTEQKRNWLTKELKITVNDNKFMRGKGCSQCQMTGFKGRAGVFEVLEVNEQMADAIRKQDFDLLHHALAHQQFKSYVHHAYTLATKGITSMSEVMRLAIELEEDQNRGVEDAIL